MPNYEFQCDDCGCYEKMLTLKEFEAENRCPECGKPVRSVLYAPAVHMRYSNLHPRHLRGQRGKTKRVGRVI